MIRGSLAAMAVLMAGCGGYRDCSEVDVTAAIRLPELLSQTGWSSDLPLFTPRFPLWTDGAEKRRWLLLPPGTQVDTSDPENWVFPVQTRVFKEFVRDGVRVETRMLLRDTDGWTGVAYIWASDQSDAVASVTGQSDVLGTAHDVPSAGECFACHGGRESVVLGFSATQVSVVDREAYQSNGVFSDPVTTEFGLSDAARDGLGVLHANCSHCHNAERDALPQVDTCYRPGNPFDFTLPAGLSSLEDTPAIATAANALGRPGHSSVVRHMSKRNTSLFNPSMPPLGTEVVDDAGIGAVEALLAELP